MSVDWKNQLGSVVIVIGIFGGILALLDGLVLTDNQKGSIRNKTLNMWNSLDDIRRGYFVNFLRKRSTRLAYIVGGMLYPAAISIMSFLNDQTITITVQENYKYKVHRSATLGDFIYELPYFIIDASILCAAAAVSNFILMRLLGRNSHISFVKASTTISVMLICSWIAIHYISLKIARIYYTDTSIDVIFTVLDVVSHNLVIVIIFPIAVVYVGLGVTYLSELILRKIAEQPKGPIAAVSAIMTFAGAALKAFS